MNSRSGRKITATQKNMRRDARNSSGFGMGYALLTILLLLVVMVLAFTVFFKVETIEVMGNSRYTADEIVKASEFSYGDNLYLFDKFGKIDKMLESLPYLENVQIRRELPGTIRITIIEAVPTGMIRTSEGVWLLDKNGRLLELLTDTEAPEGMLDVRGISPDAPKPGEVFHVKPRFIPLTASEQAFVSKYGKCGIRLKPKEDALAKGEAPYTTLIHAFDKHGFTEYINYIDMTESYNIKFMYDGRLLVSTGLPEKLETKIAYFAEVLKKLDKYSRGTIDLSGEKIRFVPSNTKDDGGNNGAQETADAKPDELPENTGNNPEEELPDIENP